MKTEVRRDVAYYMALPYTKSLKRDEDGDVLASINEFSGCTVHGDDEVEALARLEEVKEAWISDRIQRGQDIPLPEEVEDLPSGKWVQRVTRTLHKRLTNRAKREGVSLNHLVATILAEAVSVRVRDSKIVERIISHTLSEAAASTRAVVAGHASHGCQDWLLYGPAYRPTENFPQATLGLMNKLIPETRTLLQNDEEETATTIARYYGRK